MTTADDFKCYHAPWVVRILLVIYTYIYPCHLRMCWPWWDVILCWHLWCWWAQKTPQERESHPTPTLPRRPYPTAVCAHIVVLWMFSRFLCIGIVFFFFFWLECNCFFCVRFCCSTKWISYVHTYISHLGSLSHPRPHPTPLGHHRAPSWNCSHVLHTCDFVSSNSSLYADFHLLFFKSTRLYCLNNCVN